MTAEPGLAAGDAPPVICFRFHLSRPHAGWRAWYMPIFQMTSADGGDAIISFYFRRNICCQFYRSIIIETKCRAIQSLQFYVR